MGEEWKPGEDDRALVIRTCNADGTSFGGFRWPTSGYVEAPDWNSEGRCGGGLHGLLDGVGDYSLLSNRSNAIWQVVEVSRAACVKINDSKVKFLRGNVIYSGAFLGAMQVISKSWKRASISIATAEDLARIATSERRCHAATVGESANSVTAGDHANAITAGDYANAIAVGGYANAMTAGCSAHAATAGDCAGATASGRNANATAIGKYSKAMTCGCYSDATTAGAVSHAVTVGESSNAAANGSDSVAACLGSYGKAKAGVNGVVVLRWNDAVRVRITVGYVGENGIKADTWYQVNCCGVLVEA